MHTYVNICPHNAPARPRALLGRSARGGRSVWFGRFRTYQFYLASRLKTPSHPASGGVLEKSSAVFK